MNLDAVWNSPGNSPTSMERDAVVGHARDTIRGLQRRRAAFLAWTLTALSAVTAWATYVWAARVSGGGWPLHALLAAQWAVFFYLLRQMLRTRRWPLAGDATIRESLEALRREADNERRRCIAVLTLFAVAVPLMAAAILHLLQAGKMAADEALSAGVLFASIAVIAVTVILVRLYRIVLPRRRRADALLRQYRDE